MTDCDKVCCVFYIPSNSAGVGTPEVFSWTKTNRNTFTNVILHVLTDSASSYVHYVSNQSQWPKKKLTFRWFLLRGKLLHVVNIDVTNSVGSIQQRVLVCFSQFCNLLLESRLQNGSENYYLSIIALTYHLSTIHIHYLASVLFRSNWQNERDPNTNTIISPAVTKCYPHCSRPNTFPPDNSSLQIIWCII